MMRSHSLRPSLVFAALLAGAVFAAPSLAPPAEAAGGGITDRPASPGTPEIVEEWKLVSALDKAIVEQQCPGCCPLPGGLDHVANGGGARNEGHASIRLRGVPPASVPVVATLYIGVIDAPPSTPTITVHFEGHPVVAGLRGVSADPCWNPAGVYLLYAADVLPFIPPWVNGDYQVSGIPTFRSDGADPWTVFGNTLPLAEGASLVVTYSHRDVPPHSMVYTHEGPSTFLGGGLTLLNALNPPVLAAGFLRHTRLGGDGQKGVSITPQAPIAADTTAINGNQIKGPGAPDNQDSDWNGDDGVPLNQLWDTHTTGLRPGTIVPGAAIYQVDYFSPLDCVSPSVHVLTAF